MSTDYGQPMPLTVPTEFPPADIDVPFGDLPNQVLPLAWAEQFLRIVYAEYPGTFRAILPRLYGLPADAPKRTRKQP